jgi:hypothetical protein
MHPLNSRNFGATGIQVTFYNGTSVVPGYIVKQTGTNTFIVTDGTVTQQATLAPTLAIATALSSSPNQGYCTIQVAPAASGASGATITPTYGVQSALVISSNSNWNVGDVLSLPSGGGTLTVSALNSNKIATVTVSAAGTYTALLSSPVTGRRAAGSGATLTAHYGVDSATIVAGGASSSAGYAINDVLTLTGTGSAQITVDTVDGGGGILTFHVSAVGTITSLPSNPVATSGGTGAGATFNLKWHLLSVSSSGGTGYNVGDTLIWSGQTATTAPTAHISVATSHAATTVVVDTPGSGITVAGTITTSTTTASFTLGYSLLSVSGSGGTGYAANDELSFTGLVAATNPTAHVATVSTGAISTITVDTHGVNITTAATSVGVGGAIQYVARIWDTKLYTVEGNEYYWSTTGANGSAIVLTY